jgi:sialic acid synthase SpsE|tara:strand:- start:6222 stop:6953 length:732 start_codon:yes stop_codon:yes gene_type:complete
MQITIIAEIASNWEGSLSKAKKLLQESKDAGADAVKFQMWRANDLYKGHPDFKLIKKSELTYKKAKEIKKFADKIGIEFFCSAFNPDAVKFLETLGVKRYKVASRTCTLKDDDALDTLKIKAKTKKPIIISMGEGGNKSLIKKNFSKNKTTFCYCISEYPTPINKINWKEAMKYDGFSDHTLGITAPIIFSILKKQNKAKNILIEKHVKLENSKGPDASTSITTKELSDLISHVIIIGKTKLK